MAGAIGLGLRCGLSSGMLVADKSAFLGFPALKNTGTSLTLPVRFPAKRVVGCAASTTRKPRGIMVPQRISPALEELLGVPEISRTQALKLIWAHIKSNNLQDPENKKIIVCDEKLKKVFGKDRVGFLEVSGLITPHFLKSQA